MKNKNYYVAIMAGGIGSRFWPKSRTSKPKQFLDILKTGKSLLQTTYDRYLQFIPKENIFIISFIEYTDLILQQIPDINKSNILSEPSRKNTAPCIAYISFKLQEINPDAKLICSPADHLISPNEEFTITCLKALEFIEKQENAFVTIGIKPTYPNTGFGYIQFTKNEDNNICKVKTFTEKPNKELAEQFLESGDFLWNSGVFIANNKTIIDSFEKHLNDIYELFNKHKTLFNTQLENKSIEKIYPQCVNLSFDYGIMEKVSNVFIIPASFTWNDLGTWNGLYDVVEKDINKNALLGNKIMTKESFNNIINSDSEKLVIVRGLENYIIIDTQDALLIYPKDKEQEIREVTEDLKNNNMKNFL